MSDSEDYILTESLSSITRWGLAGVVGLVPFILLYLVNKIFMVASRTSDKLCLICTKEGKEKDTLQQKEGDRTISLTIQVPVTVIHVMVTPAMTALFSRNATQSFETDMPNGCTFMFDSSRSDKCKASKYIQPLPKKGVSPSS